MKKLMQNDLFLKILSFALAAFFWIYIVFITNPEIEVKITDIPITLANHQTIKNAGYIVSNDITTTVDIRVKGTRRMLADLDRDSIIAYVDLIDCTDKKAYELPVNIKLPYEDISLVSSNTIKVPVSVDKYITKEFPISSSYTGSLKDSRYSVYKTELYTETVAVSGPEPILNTVEKATVTIDLNNSSDDISGFAPVTLLNSNNAEVTSNTLDIKNKDVSFKCIVYAEKSVPVQPKLNEGSDYECTVSDHPMVTISGPASDVEAISSIPTAPFSIADVGVSMTYKPGIITPQNITIEDDIKYVTVLVTKK